MKIELTQTNIFCLTCEPEDGKKRTHIKAILPQAKFVEPIIGIPKNKLVFGRHGGFNTFDIPFVSFCESY